MSPGPQSLKICVVSNVASSSVGGLASYMRFLLDSLAPDHTVSAVARFAGELPHGVDYAGSEAARTIAHGRYRTEIVSPRPTMRPLLRSLGHCVSRPALQPLAVRVVQQAYGREFQRAIPADADVVHFVGTGWELIGFAALSVARRHGGRAWAESAGPGRGSTFVLQFPLER